MAGALISISTSAVGEHFASGANSYSAFKAAVTNWTLGQAQVLGAKGIRCNVVSPGPIWVDGGDWSRVKEGRPEFFEATEKTHPMGSIGDVQDVADGGRLPRLAGREAHQRRQPHRRRRLHEARQLLIDMATRATMTTQPGGADRRRARRGRGVARLRLRPPRAAEAARRTRGVPGALPGRLRGHDVARARRARTMPRILVTYTCDVRPSDGAQRIIRGLGRERRPDGRPARHELVARSDRRGMGRAARLPAAGSTRSARSSSPIRRSRRISSRTSHPTTGSSTASRRSRPPTSCTSTSTPTGSALVPLLQTTYRGDAEDSSSPTGTTPVPTTS